MLCMRAVCVCCVRAVCVPCVCAVCACCVFVLSVCAVCVCCLCVLSVREYRTILKLISKIGFFDLVISLLILFLNLL